MSSLPQTQRREPPVIANVTNLLAANMKAIQSCLPNGCAGLRSRPSGAHRSS